MHVKKMIYASSIEDIQEAFNQALADQLVVR
jgi:hypothetical protein